MASTQGKMPKDFQLVKSVMDFSPSSNNEISPRNLLMRYPTIMSRSSGGKIVCVPTMEAMTPPLSISPINTTGTCASLAKPMLAMSPARRFISAGEPAPSTKIKSASSPTRSKLSMTDASSLGFIARYSRAFAFPQTLPCTTT